MLNDYMIFTGQLGNRLPIQTQYEIQALRLAMSWDYPFSSIEEMDAIIDRLRYSISEIVITILLWGQSTTYTPETE